MPNRRRTLYFAAVSLFAWAFAAAPASAAGWLQQAVHVTSVHARDIGADIYVEGTENPAGCTQTGVMRIESSVPNRQDFIATALTAFSLSKPVTAYVSGCTADGVPLILTMWAHNN